MQSGVSAVDAHQQTLSKTPRSTVNRWGSQQTRELYGALHTG